jgi:hypothetical protein
MLRVLLRRAASAWLAQVAVVVDKTPATDDTPAHSRHGDHAEQFRQGPASLYRVAAISVSPAYAAFLGNAFYDHDQTGAVVSQSSQRAFGGLNVASDYCSHLTCRNPLVVVLVEAALNSRIDCFLHFWREAHLTASGIEMLARLFPPRATPTAQAVRSAVPIGWKLAF